MIRSSFFSFFCRQFPSKDQTEHRLTSALNCEKSSVKSCARVQDSGISDELAERIVLTPFIGYISAEGVVRRINLKNIFESYATARVTRRNAMV